MAATSSNLTRLAIAAAVLLGGGAAAMGAELAPLRYGQAFSAERSVFSLPVHIAQRFGAFAREGLDVRQVFIPGGGDRMISALDDGTVDVTHVAMSFLIQRALAGSDAVAVAAEFDTPIYRLVAKPGINRFADLKGKVVGMADEAGPIALSMLRLLAGHGMTPGDIQIRTVSGTPARLACLKRGTCEAVPLGQPQDVQAEREGYRVLGSSTDAVPRYLYTVTAARRSWAEAHAGLVVRYVRALGEAFQFIRDPAHRRDVIATLVDDTQCTAADAAATLALYFNPERHVLPRRGEIDIEALRGTIGMMGEAHELNSPLPLPDRFVDLRYLRAAGVR